MTTAFVKLQMFKDQNSRKASSPSLTSASSSAVPFLQWKVGYVIKNKNASSSDTWVIKKITSEDGKMHYQDTVVAIENAAEEKRELKGSTLQSGYEFVSKGDVVDDVQEKPQEKPARDDCEVFVVNVSGIREFYPRKRGEGTRILMQDKTAYIVADTVDEVCLAIKRAVAESLSGLAV